MPDLHVALLASTLALAFLAAAVLARRPRHPRRDLRRVLGLAAACGGAAMLIASLTQ
ncbi:hypothetical protein H8N03_14380 [Ramlibacter sp. USB13]|uniref:Uncharacterized protein n=1 Tax=Ramlibacter cellulosilyticus TaxID=2764187 RepID=A0A923SBQ3_9BURK|nr:hypothetical protein [Ramlibacter cellulosilyticus]MBC5784136.1 hypothetical protein [Ramlibacter cellulosilyticus]